MSKAVAVDKKYKQILDILKDISGRYTFYQVFDDWVKCMAICIRNNCSIRRDDVWRQWEKEYISTISKYTKEQQDQFSEMFAYLAEILTEKFLSNELEDVLGNIYMQYSLGAKSFGQEFTPIDIARLCADITRQEEASIQEVDGKITMYEPACGGGMMVLSLAEQLKKQGVNYQRKLKVVCQDIDFRCVYMCYVQLSLLGIDAVVVQGNTLTEPYYEGYPEDRTFRSPKNTGLLI